MTRWVGALGGRGAAVAGSLAFYLFASRTLAVTDAGLVFLLITWVGAFSMLARLGMDTSMIPVYSRHVNEMRWRVVVRLAVRNAALIAGCGVAGSIIVLVALAQAARAGGIASQEVVASLAIGSLSVGVAALSVHNGALHKCLDQRLVAQVIEGGGGLVFGLLACVVGTAFFGDLSLVAVLTSVFIGHSLMLFVSVMLLAVAGRRFRDALPLPSASSSLSPREAVASSLPYLGASILTYLLLWLPSMVMGWAGQLEDVAKFNSIARIGALVVFGLSVVNVYAAPRIAELLRVENVAGLQILAWRTSNFSFGFGACVLIAAVAVGDLVMSAFGPEFAAAGIGLAVYCCGQLVNAYTGSSSYLLQLSGSAGTAFRILLVSFLTFGLGACIAGLVFGFIGAVVGVAGAVALQNLAIRAVLWRRVGIASNPRWPVPADG